MAGMKRFVTYIYAYEEEKKGSNVGFARIEIRGQDARIEIHLRGVYAASAACRVYLFQREAAGGKEATGVTGVLVGEMKLANGSGDGAVVLKGGRVGASPYGITEMEGLFFVIGEGRILMSRWREGAPFKVGLSGFREWQPEKLKEKTAEKGAAAETAAQKEVREAAAAQAEQNSQTAAQEMAQGKQGGAAPVQSEQNSRMAAKGMAQDVPSGSRAETAAAGEEMEAIHATELPMRNLFPEYDWNAVWEELCREHKPAALFEEWDTQCILSNVEQIPAVRFDEAKQKVAEKYHRQIRNPYDLEPEEEALIGQYYKEECGADFVFVTHYPSKKRPFYAMDDPADPTYTLSFDLLYHGLEITTGGQRIHDYQMLLDKIEKRGMTTEGMEQYLAVFKYGMPPHGGLGIGLERLTMKLVGEDNVRETTLFPRDLSRLEP